MDEMEIKIRIGTGIKARNGDEIFVGDEIETVQGTRFKVGISPDGVPFLERPEGLYSLEPYMSPNIWIV